MPGLNPLFFILVSSFAFAANPSWNCGPAFWVSEPQLDNGMFEATIASRCTVRDAGESSLSKLAKFIKEDLLNSGRLEVHEGPTPVWLNGMRGFEFDATDPMKDDGSPARVRQKIDCAMNEQGDRLVYSTRSKDIQGEGKAKYLRKIDLLADVQFVPEEKSAKIYFEHTVNVERPWYALAFLFKPFATSTTEEKFQLAQDRLLSYLVPHLISQPALN